MSTSPLTGYSAHFGVQNIPYGVASSEKNPSPSCVSRFEDKVIFLAKLDTFAKIDGLPHGIFGQSSLNTFAALDSPIQQAVRSILQQLIESKALDSLPDGAVENISEVRMHLPVQVGDFTDFSCSLNHVQNAAEAIFGARSEPSAFFHFPVGYAGRCSSIDISGTAVERPIGQYWEGKPAASDVVFRPSVKMDYELELGCIIGKPLARRARVSAAEAEKHIFGYVLVNDWSARDIQALEMNPLGPLNGKNAGTTMSAWIVTTEAMKSHHTRGSPLRRPAVPYLQDREDNALDITLEVHVATADDKDTKGALYCTSNTSMMYWSLTQCVAHQAIGGCGLRTGDLLATGTVSGEGPEQRGCLLEHMRPSTQPPRHYLEDGNVVTMSGFCSEGVGFGECRAELTPAKTWT